MIILPAFGNADESFFLWNLITGIHNDVDRGYIKMHSKKAFYPLMMDAAIALGKE